MFPFLKFEMPEGYEIRTVDETESCIGEFARLVPYWNGRPIAEGNYTSTGGYWGALSTAQNAIRLHYRYRVDRGPAGPGGEKQ